MCSRCLMGVDDRATVEAVSDVGTDPGSAKAKAAGKYREAKQKMLSVTC